MIEINYVKGDVTNVQDTEFNRNIIIPHICNDIGAWGAGFVLALSKKWQQPEMAYRRLSKEELELGLVQFVRVEKNVIVANMIAQHGIRSKTNPSPIIYDILKDCLQQVDEMAHGTASNVHMPKIGAGLTGGDWNSIESLIKNNLTVPTTVFIFNE